MNKPCRFDFPPSFDLACPGGEPPKDEATALMMRILHALSHKNRALASPEYDESLEFLGKIIPLTVHKIPSGAEVWSWVAPKRWTVREAWVKKGERVICDFKDHPLRLAAYSTPFSGKLSLAKLRQHLHFDADRPDAIPFAYKYYKPDWAFCLPYNSYKTLTPGAYTVRIDADLTDDFVKVGESVLKGTSEDSVILAAHLDHPGQANDGLSGVAAGVALMKRLSKLKARRLTYRLVLCPENIGSLCYLFKNRELISLFKHGVFLEALGNKNHLKLQRSKNGARQIDRLAEHALAKTVPVYGTGAFRKVVCNDEINFDGPGIDIPTVSLTRWPYPEYHTSDDNPSIISPRCMKESLDVLWELIGLLERNVYPKRKYKGNLFLSRYGLYEDLNADDTVERISLAFEGDLSVLDIAEKLGIPFDRAYEYARKFKEAGLVEFLDSPGQEAAEGSQTVQRRKAHA
ncbi:MAG: DUF4910 domain-containing protein [Elusimicrobia bacterium]|nr:DUF4910 domain-containing protein [Elusimicrobiota bacterium]